MPTIKSNERILIAGQTGTGKTYLSRYLTKMFPRLIVFDTKDELDDWDTVPFDDEAHEGLLKGESVRARVVPAINIGDEAEWEAVAEFALVCGNLTIFIDEGFAIFPGAQSYSPRSRAIWTRGRSLGIGAIMCTQRPSGIPLFTESETEHQFCFYLQKADDRKRMAEYMGEEVLGTIQDEHGFWYHTTRQASVYYPQLETNGKQTRAVTPEVAASRRATAYEPRPSAR